MVAHTRHGFVLQDLPPKVGSGESDQMVVGVSLIGLGKGGSVLVLGHCAQGYASISGAYPPFKRFWFYSQLTIPATYPSYQYAYGL